MSSRSPVTRGLKPPRHVTVGAALACVCLAASAASAQARTDDPGDQARVHLGPLGVAPSIAISGAGFDSNVFRHAEDRQSDVTVTLSPGSRAWLRAGPTRLSLEARSDLVYYRRYSSEGSLDGAIGGRYELRMRRLTPWVTGRIAGGRQRLGYEIDERARHGEQARGMGLDVALLSRTSVSVSTSRVDYRYDTEARVLGTSLHEALNRRSASVGLSVAHRVTPLTTIVVEAERIRDRFTYAPSRDSDSTRLRAGADFAPLAVISGSLRAGYRRFDALGSASSFRGLVGSVDAAYALLGRTQFAFAGRRELEYSYDLTSPYYLLTGASVSATPRLSTHWDAQGRIGRQQLAYRDAQGLTSRVDRLTTYGAGIGYRVGPSLRVGFNIDRERRTSVAHGRTFDGYRAGFAITYGGQ